MEKKFRFLLTNLLWILDLEAFILVLTLTEFNEFLHNESLLTSDSKWNWYLWSSFQITIIRSEKLDLNIDKHYSASNFREPNIKWPVWLKFEGEMIHIQSIFKQKTQIQIIPKLSTLIWSHDTIWRKNSYSFIFKQLRFKSSWYVRLQNEVMVQTDKRNSH